MTERLEVRRHELKSARNRLAVLEAERRRGDAAKDQAVRNIAADVRAGREVDLDDFFSLQAAVVVSLNNTNSFSVSIASGLTLVRP